MMRVGASGRFKILPVPSLLLLLAPYLVFSIEVTTPAELHAAVGDVVTLKCSFRSTSSPTSKMTVDWSYRPQTGGAPETFFHFSSQVFPPTQGQFLDRIRWEGTPSRGVASISLINATLKDNGTYTCSVRNPPDVHGSPTSSIVLTVTPKKSSIRFSDVSVLIAFILVPSGMLTLILIGRMYCCGNRHSQSEAYRSNIEVTEGVGYAAAREKGRTCYERCLTDSEDEDYYYHQKKRHPHDDEDYADSQV
ncbi:myelin protein zero-like protein 3 [Oryzias melastigma]|uniref:Myelin protein zero like 3 n=1 Tax=Oryzias melastigma TaxID=30732 RepID=A0A3B3D625_ORYME|nr:myelin protein zero-like protein 3 [Oryzias melastigma]